MKKLVEPEHNSAVRLYIKNDVEQERKEMCEYVAVLQYSQPL